MSCFFKIKVCETSNDLGFTCSLAFEIKSPTSLLFNGPKMCDQNVYRCRLNAQ